MDLLILILEMAVGGQEDFVEGFVYRLSPSQPATTLRLLTPPLDKESFARHLAGVFNIFEELSVRAAAEGYEEDPSGALVVRVNTRGILPGGNPNFASRSTFLVRLSEGGTVIEEVEHVADFNKLLKLKRHAPGDYALDFGAGSSWVRTAIWGTVIVVGGTALGVARLVNKYGPMPIALPR